MYSYLIGKIKKIEKNSVVIENLGIGYNIFVHDINLYKLEEEAKIFVVDLIKENSEINLYGFLEFKYLQLFKKLILVNGVGPKTTLQIFKNISFDRLIYLIKKGEAKELSRVSGIGNKAELICHDLKNKLNDFDLNLIEYSDVYNVLKKLKYKDNEIEYALKEIETNLDIDEAIKKAIRIINNERSK